MPNLSEPIALMRNLILVGGGVFLVAGFCTPLTGLLIAADEFWIAFGRGLPASVVFWIHTFLALLSISVAMLGPGAWSIDARMFGRMRYDINPSRRKADIPRNR
jgi:putative oxidoreductase